MDQLFAIFERSNKDGDVNTDDHKQKLTFWWLEVIVIGAMLAVMLLMAH